MSPQLSRGFLRGSMACAAAALGLTFAAGAQAQPYYDQPDPSYASSDVGGLTVIAPRHRERTWNGAPIVNVSASRVVDISDLDLSTGWGVHVMHQRIHAAAADACNELDTQWTQGLYPTADSSDVDCYHRAVRDSTMPSARDAEASARDVDYTGY